MRHSRLGSLRYGSRQSHPLPITPRRRSARLARHPVCHPAAAVRGCWLGTRGRLRVALVANGRRVVRGEVAGIVWRAGWRRGRAAPLRVRTANALVFVIMLCLIIRNYYAKSVFIQGKPAPHRINAATGQSKAAGVMAKSAAARLKTEICLGKSLSKLETRPATRMPRPVSRPVPCFACGYPLALKLRF